MKFQSSPSLSEGRYRAQGPGEAVRYSFNPRPPFRKGATGLAGSEGIEARVSILALPFGRALPRCTAWPRRR